MRCRTLFRPLGAIAMVLVMFGCASTQTADETISAGNSSTQDGNAAYQIQLAELPEHTRQLVDEVARGKTWVFRVEGPPHDEREVDLTVGYFNHRGISKTGSILQTVGLEDEGWLYLVVELYFEYNQGLNHAILRVHQLDPDGSSSSSFERIEVKEEIHSRNAMYPLEFGGFPTDVPVLIGTIGIGGSGDYGAVDLPRSFPEGVMPQDLQAMSRRKLGVIGVFLEKRSN